MGCPSKTEIGENLTFSITTHDPDTAEVTDADSAPSYWIYEDETGAAILSGSMAKLDDVNTTGFYTETIACTAGNGFEDGKTYTIYIEAIVNSATGAICYGFKAETKLTDIAAAIAALDIEGGCDDALDNAISSPSAGSAAWWLLWIGQNIVTKQIITEANGNTEFFNRSEVSLGSIAARYATDGTYTTRKLGVI